MRGDAGFPSGSSFFRSHFEEHFHEHWLLGECSAPIGEPPADGFGTSTPDP